MDTDMNRERRKGRLLLIAPLVVVPLALLFGWIVMTEGRMFAGDTVVVGGFNMSLPGVHIKDKTALDKLTLYKKADQDSIRQENKLQGGRPDLPEMDSANVRRAGKAPGVERIQHKLAELKELVKRGGSDVPESGGSLGETGGRPVAGGRRPPGLAGAPAIGGSEIDRLERMMKIMKDGPSGPDPEMRELNKTLDKLMAVQHPEVVHDSLSRKPESTAAAAALPVSPALAGDVINSLARPAPVGNRFYDLETSGGGEEVESGVMIGAMIPETQTLMSGALLRLELKTELVIRGDRIPPGVALYGVTQLSNERLFVKVSAIRYREKLYPVALQVVDQDGLAGIYEPGSTTHDAVRESAWQSIGSIGPGSLDPSIGGQAASAGIQLARSLARRKIRQVQVTVKTGYRVFLEDLSQKH